MRSAIRWLSSAAFVLAASVPGLAQQGQGHGSMMGAGEHEQGGMAHEGMMGKSHAMSQLHQGYSMMTKAHHFEVVYMPDGIRVYPYDSAQKSLSAEGMQGKVTLTYKDGKTKAIPLGYKMGMKVGEGKHAMQMHDYLFAPVDLNEAEPGSFQARFDVSGLSSKSETEATFAGSFKGLEDEPYACPMHPDVWGKSAEDVCPLCGMKTTMKRASGMGPGSMMETHQGMQGNDH